ncbi:DUF4333 domain-containing protein [Mycolicibacterium frederiksbergense]|uniref:DUF4333 domain-containing protein n=1 Tax=Mycolicibacterium frederiksbergense TaxID=117567 RepID=UPI00265BBD0E|nr:DUF4333 domain-containing protein [Mycolicibacterium frederiksbergense]MDO0975603.1 DUF4333 domain-containing protein [Mycolicibacterium frederiksbergense]
MTRPPDPSQQPWWARPGGAPAPGGQPRHGAPGHGAPPPPPGPPPRQPYPPAPQQYPPRRQPPPPEYPPPPQRVPPASQYPQQQRPAPVIDPNRYTLPPGTPSSHRAPSKRSGPDRRTVLIGAGVAVALVLAGLAVWQFLFRDTTVINVEQAEAGVREILSDPINGYGANSISALRCNDGRDPSAAKGDSFTCAVEIDGTVRHVYVEFQDDNGTFAVDGPR